MKTNLLYVGTYTGSGSSRGIQLFQRDPESGALRHLAEFEAEEPSWITFDPRRSCLYCVNELLEIDGRPGGGVSSYRIDQETGALTFLNQQLTLGGAPCHLCTDSAAEFLFVANHESGNVSMLPINPDGSLQAACDVRQHQGSGPGPTQTSPHAHCTVMEPGGHRLMVVDKGIDKVMIYRVNAASRSLVSADPPFSEVHSGAAPRHIAFHPGGQFAFVNGEADMTLTAFRYDGSGTLEQIHYVSTLPDDADREGVSTAGLEVHPHGRFAYVSNRGHDSIAIFAIDQTTGELTPLGHESSGGQTPRAFGIAPEGKFMYVGNQNSDTIEIFRIDAESGLLEHTEHSTPCGAPVAFLFT